jgi:hypothetical protein
MPEPGVGDAAGKLPLRAALPFAPMVMDAAIEAVKTAFHGGSIGEIAVAGGRGAANGAFSANDAPTMSNVHERVADRVLAGGRMITATGATFFGGISLVPGGQEALPVSLTLLGANQALGLAQDAAYYSHLADHPGVIASDYAALKEYKHATEVNARQIPADNAALVHATEKGGLADYYEKALASGDRKQAETARAEYTQHLQNMLIHGKITPQNYEATDKLARTAFDDAEKQGFKPPAVEPAPQDKAKQQAHAAMQGKTVHVQYTGDHKTASYVAPVIDTRAAPQGHTTPS